jgi:hypothetical protein
MRQAEKQQNTCFPQVHFHVLQTLELEHLQVATK